MHAAVETSVPEVSWAACKAGAAWLCAEWQWQAMTTAAVLLLLGLLKQANV
jgi:hypothetical protein